MSKLTPIILIVFSVIIFFTFIDPQREKITSLRQEKQEYNEALSKAQELLRLRDELQSKYVGVRPEDLENIKLMLPDNVDNVRLALDIDALAKNRPQPIAIKNIAISGSKGASSGSTSSEATPAPEGQGTGLPGSVGVATISFSVSTNYENFIKFLKDLEDSLRIIDVTNLAVTSAEGGNYNYSLTLRTYWLK